ncbi:hypothetical protein [Ovoidimarina sediminis]|uniref:hypothetical protein n=1 Tax=Ovoidimarina sediminis TaxID=3079856 RepID=UPI0029139C2A|nr:hypothetical protein [Rhodophyticola sp. MJ-SS7]MDU8943436.1 hypothetical protein [Rhodophyticola sp. MJ-SS7]
MTGRLLLTAGAALLLSGCGVITGIFEGGDAEVTALSADGLDTVLAVDAETGALSSTEDGPEIEEATVSASAPGARGGAFEAGFGRTDGSVSTAAASAATGPGTGGIAR